MQISFADKCVLVTGGTRGIGAEIVRALARRGAGGCVCYAAGYAEVGPEGAALQKALADNRGETVPITYLRPIPVSGALVATMTAADGPLRRPARPVCCHIDAMVPG